MLRAFPRCSSGLAAHRRFMLSWSLAALELMPELLAAQPQWRDLRSQLLACWRKGSSSLEGESMQFLQVRLCGPLGKSSNSSKSPRMWCAVMHSAYISPLQRRPAFGGHCASSPESCACLSCTSPHLPARRPSCKRRRCRSARCWSTLPSSCRSVHGSVRPCCSMSPRSSRGPTPCAMCCKSSRMAVPSRRCRKSSRSCMRTWCCTPATPDRRWICRASPPSCSWTRSGLRWT